MKISDDIKKQLYHFENIELNGTLHISNADQLMSSITLGERVMAVCDSLELDFSIAKDMLLKYGVHQIKKKSITLTANEKTLLENFADDTLGERTLGDILNETHFTDPEAYFKMYDSSIMRLFPVKKELERSSLSKQMFKDIPISYDHLEYGKESGLGFNARWHPYSHKLGSFFQLYMECGVLRAKMAINTAPHNMNITSNKLLFEKLLYHYGKYQELLTALPSEYDISEDLLLFERKTDLFFLLKAYSMLINDEWFNSIEFHKQEEYLKVLSAFTLVDDLKLKIYLVERFIAEGSIFMYADFALGYIPLLRLLFIQIPLMREIMNDALVYTSSNVIKEREKAKKVKIRLNNYRIVENFHCYNITELQSEPLFKIDVKELGHSELFFRLYKKVYKIREVKKEFIEQTTNKISKIIHENSDVLFGEWDSHIEAILYSIADQFKTEGEYLSLIKPEEENNIIDADAINFHFDRKAMVRKLEESGINFENLGW
ncbi:hypothetical protein ABE504_25255 [Paenibacillus oryzisoli]|uniref:hypothetical protein n=1 Tax=Paenibacillus oryzisoli TaxID=1850517 RepID=UPI003D2DAB12